MVNNLNWSLNQGTLADSEYITFENIYEDYLITEKKSGDKMLKAIQAHFNQWGDKQLTDINEFLVASWRKDQLKKGRTAGAVNRPIAYLRALLNHAYRVSKVIKNHPLATFKQLKEDKLHHLIERGKSFDASSCHNFPCLIFFKYQI